MQRVLFTRGAGFIGQNLEHTRRRRRPADRLVVIDAVTYATHIPGVEPMIADRSIAFVKCAVGNGDLVRRLFNERRYTHVAHFAAEFHVDRSIAAPEPFLQTNVLGTSTLKKALNAWRNSLLEDVRFLHAASKGASDHLARSFVATYGLPALITNFSNNYAPSSIRKS